MPKRHLQFFIDEYGEPVVLRPVRRPMPAADMISIGAFFSEFPCQIAEFHVPDCYIIRSGGEPCQ